MSLLAGLSQQGDSISAHNADVTAHGASVTGRAVLTGTAAQGREALGIATDVGGSEPAGYYVDSVAGNDTNSGRTSAAPWRTLSKLNSTTIGNGSRIFIKCGSHLYGAISKDVSNIFMAPYGNGVRPILDGSIDPALIAWEVHSETTYKAQISLGTKAYPQVADLTASGSTPHMLRVVASAAAVVAQPGSCFHDGTYLYVQKWDGTALGASDVAVCGTDNSIQLGSGAVVRNLEFRNGYGSTLNVGINSLVESCEFKFCGKHHVIIGGGIIRHCKMHHTMAISDLPDGYSAIAFYFSDNSNPAQDAVVESCHISYGLAADDNTCVCTPAGNVMVQHNAGAGTGYYRNTTVQHNTLVNHGGLTYGNGLEEVVINGNQFIDFSTSVAVANAKYVRCNYNKHLVSGKHSGLVFSSYTFDHRGTASTPMYVSIIGDYISGSSVYSTGSIYIPGTGAYVNLDIRRVVGRMTGLQSLIFAQLQTGSANCTINLEDCDLTGSTAYDIISILGTNNTFTGKNNQYGQGLNFFLGDHKTLVQWKAATGSDTDSTYKSTIVGFVDISGSTGTIAVGNHYQLLDQAFPGLVNTDRMEVTCIGSQGNPNTWATIAYAIPGADKFIFIIRNLSTSSQSFNFSCRVTAYR